MRIVKCCLTLFLLMLLSITTFAHPGMTDENGGHYDYSTGEYHYHHGYPAHQHENGVCPYDFKDNTDYNNSEIIAYRSNNHSNKEFSFWLTNNGTSVITVIVLAIFIIFLFVPDFFIKIKDKIKENNKNSPLKSIIKFFGLILMCLFFPIIVIYKEIKNSIEKNKNTK